MKVVEDSQHSSEEHTREQFRFDIIPLKGKKWLVWLFIFLIPMLGSVILLPVLGKLYFSTTFQLTPQTIAIILGVSLFLAIFCVLDGIFAGFWWKRTGRWLTNLGFLRPLESMIEKQQKGLELGYMNKFIFGSGENFLLFNALDVDHSSLWKMAKSNLKSLQLLAAMFVVVLNFLVKWSGFRDWLLAISNQGAMYLNNYLSVFAVDLQTPLQTFILFYITLSIALTILAIVLPLLLITDHAFVYQFTKDRRVKEAGSKPRKAIYDTFSIFTIISGFNLIRNDIQLVQNPNLLIDLLIFVALLIIIMVYGIPIVFAAFNTYYTEHAEIVNELRDTLRRAGFPIAYSENIPVSAEILDNLEILNSISVPDYHELQERKQILQLAYLIREASELSNISSLENNQEEITALQEKVKSQIQGLGYKNVVGIHNKKTDTQAALGTKDGNTFIAFPGTHGMKDILTDLEAGDSSFTCENRIKRIFRSSSKEVHKGANKAVCSCIDNLQNYLQQQEPEKVIITGHSLGGMLGTILTGYLLENHENLDIELYTFGNPAVGNFNFAEFVNNNVSKSLLIANKEDPVPNLLPEFLDYFHLPNKVILDRDGDLVSNSEDIVFPSETSKAVGRIIRAKTIPSDHFMDEYIRRLELKID